MPPRAAYQRGQGAGPAFPDRANGYTSRMSDTLCPDDRPLPYLTDDLPGVGGVIKAYNEDFFVEEIPRYEPSGDGTHVYLTIEKSGMTTPEAIGLLAQRLGRRPGEFGYAGMKDAHGVTRQRVSIEHIDPKLVEGLDLTRLRVCDISRHTNKIKLGHLSGNRFTIRIRDCDPDPLNTVGAILQTLQRRGVPNYFGPQRFGVRGDNAEVGLCVLRRDYAGAMSRILGRPMAFERADIQEARRLFDTGDYAAAAGAWPKRFRDQARLCAILAEGDGNAKRAWQIVRRQQRALYFSALQSALFNQVVARRIGRLDHLLLGEVAWIHRNGACFHVEDVAAEQPRCNTFEISPTGPLFGRKMKAASGDAAELEIAVLRDAGLEPLEVASPEHARLDGARRPLRVPLADTSCDAGEDVHGRFVEVRFALPPGSYATVVTRELTKMD